MTITRTRSYKKAKSLCEKMRREGNRRVVVKLVGDDLFVIKVYHNSDRDKFVKDVVKPTRKKVRVLKNKAFSRLHGSVSGV